MAERTPIQKHERIRNGPQPHEPLPPAVSRVRHGPAQAGHRVTLNAMSRADLRWLQKEARRRSAKRIAGLKVRIDENYTTIRATAPGKGLNLRISLFCRDSENSAVGQ